MFGPQLRQLVAPQNRQEAINVLPVTDNGGLGQFVGGNVPEPQLRILCQRHVPVHRLGQRLALTLEQQGLLIEPFLPLLWCKPFGRMDCLLLGLAALAVIVVAHGDHDEVAFSPFAYTCHITVDLTFF